MPSRNPCENSGMVSRQCENESECEGWRVARRPYCKFGKYIYLVTEGRLQLMMERYNGGVDAATY